MILDAKGRPIATAKPKPRIKRVVSLYHTRRERPARSGDDSIRLRLSDGKR